jgi:hypothetical protein
MMRDDLQISCCRIVGECVAMMGAPASSSQNLDTHAQLMPSYSSDGELFQALPALK